MRTLAHAVLILAAAGVGTAGVLLLRSARVLAAASREVVR
jgi:hypothetical protein